MRWVATLGTAGLILFFAGAASARYMPYAAAITAINYDSRQASYEVDWDDGPRRGKCGQGLPSLYECQISLEGRLPYDYDTEVGIIYEAHFCSWVAVAKWRFRSVVVKRREFGCEHWTETSR
jgi:hypothetical protein